ncbi:MAG: alanine--tRNA ligase, partial [bacterium]
MTHAELRKIFFEYFEKKGHRQYPSISLVPDDPTLLFTTAGMVQFKDMFLGIVKMKPPKAVSIQKCLRTSDIDNVGRTMRHLTFFEMLGNFSAGGYFKEEAIQLAWEFLTKDLKMDVSRLYATVHRKDKEAFEIWKKIIPAGRIVKLGDEDNFWAMAETGPCGYCSEIIYDMGEGAGCGKKDCSVGCSCDRWIEVWNLVFTEFDRNASGGLSHLAQKNIDTGMGFERLLMVLNGLKSTYETDVLKPLVDRIEASCKTRDLTHIRRLADHVRASAFIIGDGVSPSNTGRGYVLRRLIRRAMVSADKVGFKHSLTKLMTVVFDIFGDVYPALVPDSAGISLTLKNEEERFKKSLETGMEILKDALKKIRGKDIIPAALCFEMYATYGFPIELLEDIASSYKLSIDEKGFGELLEKEKEMSKTSWTGSGARDEKYLKSAAAEAGITPFRGYDTLNLRSKIVLILENEKKTDSVKKGAECEAVLSETPFYASSGGQVNDTGRISGGDFEAEVLDVYVVSGTVFHRLKVLKGSASFGDDVSCSVDEERRSAIERNHTATHLLQTALRSVIGAEVRQAGSAVTPDALRFDFTVSRKIEDEELDKVSEIVNKIILDDRDVYKKEYSASAAKKLKALHFFEEKYGEVVRIVTVGSENPDEAVSAEFCGGCHVSRTGRIGLLKITAQKAVAQGIRRIEAVTGFGVLKYLAENEALLSRISERLKTDVQGVEKKVEKLLLDGKNKKASVDIT